MTLARTRTITRNASLDNFDVLNGGFLRIYDGTMPASPETALGAQVLLAELTLNATAFAAATGSAGAASTKTANAITQDSSANATGTATWGSLVTSGGTRVMDMDAGTAAANIILNTTSIVSGAVVSCSSLILSQAMT